MPAGPLELISCDAASAAISVAALLADADPQPRTAVVIGPNIRSFVRSLTANLPRLAVTVLEVDAVTLSNQAEPFPFADQQFDLVVSLDLLSLLPRERRLMIFRALTNTARHLTLAAEPLGTDLQQLIDRSLINFYRELFRTDHAGLAALVDYGLPNPQEAFGWIRHGDQAEIFYAGDVLAYQHTAERLIRRAYRLWLRSFPSRLTYLAFIYAEPSLDEPDTFPRRRHRRFFLLHFRRT